MVIAYHIIFGAYGYWLPNDPRGSWSDKVWAEQLRCFGDATKVTTRESLAHRGHDHNARLIAKQQLKYPAVKFNDVQVRTVVDGFSKITQRLELQVHACAVMPDHVHLVTGRHRLQAEEVAGFLKRAAARQLTAEEVHPHEPYRRADGSVPSPWADGGWYVYLNTPPEVRPRIKYVEDNPLERGLPRQKWSFVVPFLDV